jgi:hypothetical protein
MALNQYRVTADDDQSRIPLRGDMSVLFDDTVTTNFMVGFYTTTDETFLFESALHQFRNTEGQLVQGLIVGGQPGHFIELMFDPEALIWYITANNLVGAAGGNPDAPASGSDAERELTFAVLPAMTAVDYAVAKNFRGTINANAKLANPKNMKPGDQLRIIIVQDLVGSRTLAYDGAYGFIQAQYPTLSTIPQSTDVLTCYMTGDKSLICDLRANYSIVRPLAYTTDFAFTMQTAYNQARDSEVNGQTVQIIRDGYRLECNGAIGTAMPAGKILTMRVRGKKKANGALPTLKLERTDRPTFQKAIVDIEGGANIVVEDLAMTGATDVIDGNACGLLINPNVDYVRVQGCWIYDNENGIRTAVSTRPKFDLFDCLIEKNGRSSNQTHAGQTHNIYTGNGKIMRAERVTFRNCLEGHNIKSRAYQTVLKQVLCDSSAQSRELDICDQGLLHATDCVFFKPVGVSQNNVVGIGYENVATGSRIQEYFFINCYFHNDVNITRNITYLANKAGGSSIDNTVAVHFIDCLFGGLALTKTTALASLFEGPYTITRTGGPLGPGVHVGVSRGLFAMSRMDPNASPNPAGITETPFDQLPPMTVTEPTPPYPTFAEVPIVPPLPSFDGTTGVDDKIPPVIALNTLVEEVLLPGSVTLYADVSDNVGVSKVEFYRNGVLFDTAVSLPFDRTVSFTRDDNGTVTFTGKAIDFNGNTAVSEPVVIAVNIPAPHEQPTTRFDAALQATYDTAITVAAAGTKRQAAADAIVTTFTKPIRLYIYRNGVLVIPVEYGINGLSSRDDGYDVIVETPDGLMVDSSDPLLPADINTGTWWYELQGGPEFKNFISGTVGGVDSGAEIEIAESPAPGQGFSSVLQFIMPRALDDLQ